MREVTNCLSGAALSLMLVAGTAFGQATIEIGSVEGSGTIDITLSTGGAEVVGTENVIEFGPDVVLTECTINPDIMREASQAAFQPSGCDAAAGDCEAVKALILSFSNLDPIPDGSVLYSCEVDAAGAAPGDYALTCTGPGASDAAGNSVDTTCTDGTVTVPDTPVARLVVGDATGVPGGTAQVDITLELIDSAAAVAGTENVLSFSPEAAIVGCEFNPDIMREASAVSFQPSGCDEAAGGCESLKALVLSFSNLDPLPDGVVLYTCDVALAGGTAAATVSGVTGDFPITCSETAGSDPEGNPLTMECVDGTVTIEDEPTPMPTATETPTPEDPTPTSTPDEPTATPEATATNTRPPGGFDDDSCAIVAPEASSSGWMLLMPMAALLWLRRRTR